MKVGYDLDGVLALVEGSWTKEKALQAERTSLRIPEFHQAYIITCRGKEMREGTEAWLQEHGLDHQELIMVDDEILENHTDSEIVFRVQVEHKKRWINRLDLDMFIEDNSLVTQKLAEMCPDCKIIRYDGEGLK